MESYLGILSGPVMIGRTEFYTYLMKNYVSNETFQLWRNILKPILLDRNLTFMEFGLLRIKNSISCVRCRRCPMLMKWVDLDILDADEIYFMCPNCPQAKPILKCDIGETVKFLIDLIDRENPQIVAAAIKSILLSGYLLNAVSPPAVPDNPFEAFKAIYEKSPNILKFGGSQAVIIADIYESKDLDEFPILYIADTVSIPTRYFLYALKFKCQAFNPGTNDEHNPNVLIPKYQEDYLVKELIRIANAHLKPGSYLVLGRKLQHYISEERYSSQKNHNLSIILPLSSLCPLDKKNPRPFAVTENFEKIIDPAVHMCGVVESAIKLDLYRLTPESIYKYLQKHLDAIIWLTTFGESPFEALIYHICIH